MDNLTLDQRKLVMSRVRGRDTSPEKLVRSLLHNEGYRFRLRNRDLPGNPDIANRKGGWVIFVHGCFWHSHPNCRRASIPKTNRKFWQKKLAENRLRDQAALVALKRRGFRVLVIWQCHLPAQKDVDRKSHRIVRAMALLLHNAVNNLDEGTTRTAGPSHQVK